MQASARENILKKIRTALEKPTKQLYYRHKIDSVLFNTIDNTLIQQFSIVLKELKGDVFICSDSESLVAKLTEFALDKKLGNIGYRPTPLLRDLGLEKLEFINNPAEGEEKAAVTDCDFLVARTGSVVLSSRQASGRLQSVYTPIHIVIAYKHQLVADIGDVLSSIAESSNGFPSFMTFASGPSRTGDIERTLVLGVHGPVEVYVFIIER